MKKYIFAIILGCTVLFPELSRGVGGAAVKPDTIPADSVEYRLIIIDPYFDTWLATKPPMSFFSNSYYADKNWQYVEEWNLRFKTGKDRDLYETFIDYNRNTDYGIELNYRLYNYFRYFEETNHVKLLRSFR